MIFFILLLLILANAYFSAAEIALVSVKKFRIQEEADKGNKGAGQILDLLKNPDEYLSSIQVGITLVGIIEGLYGGEALEAYLEPKLVSWGLSSWFAHTLSIVLGIGFITYITVVIGELLPKSIALQSPQKIALGIGPSFSLFSLLAYPFVKLLTGSTHLLIRLFRVRGSENQKLTDADLKSLLSLAYRQGTLEKDEWALHENIFNFYDRTIGKIMTPLEKVITIDETMSLEIIDGILRNSTHHFFPVVQQKNKIVGYLSARDFFIEPGKTLKEITYASCTVTANQNAPELLQKFKDYKHNFGIVVNEGGSLAGVVTMHDVAEILIGKIP
jgi:putative hemolysin